MKKFLFIGLLLAIPVLNYSQSKDIIVTWECNMNIEILAGRFDPLTDTISVRGDFNGWSQFDMSEEPGNPGYYITPSPIIIPQLQVGDIVAFYKFYHTSNIWETGDNRIYILTQADFDLGQTFISRSFNDVTLETVTNQETTIQFFVDCSNAVSSLTGQPFPEINTCNIAGGTLPLQWPNEGWPDYQLYLMIPTYDDGINGGDITEGDKIFSAQITFPIYTPFLVQYKYSINYGDMLNNSGGNDNEAAGYGNDHFIELSQYMQSAVVENIFGTMGIHRLINISYVPVEFKIFSAHINGSDVILSWETSTETNNKGFEIERKADKLWEEISFVTGNGTTTLPHSYLYTDKGAAFDHYVYRLKQIDFNGSYSFSDEVEAVISNPSQFILSQNYPNPFNPSTRISWHSSAAGFNILKVYNILGQEVTTLLNEYKSAGEYNIIFDAGRSHTLYLASGVYFYRLQIVNPQSQKVIFEQTRKMLLIK